MKSIVESQLTGKWYLVAGTLNRYEKRFVEIMYYISIGCENEIDLLQVGVKNNGTKSLKKKPLKIMTKDDSCYLVVGKGLFKKSLKILTFDKNEEILILSNNNMKYISILSKKMYVNHNDIERYLSNIEFLNKEIKLYSNNIVSEDEE